MNEKKIIEFCEKKGLIFDSIIHNNPDKDSFVALAYDKNTKKKLIIKIIGDKTTQEFKKSFVNECEFYSKFESNYTTKLIDSGENFLILENFGINLREHIKRKYIKENKNNINALLKEISYVLDWCHNLGSGKYPMKEIEIKFVTDTLYNRIGNLASSGPEFSTPSKFESFAIRQIWKVFSKKLKHNLKKLVTSWKKTDMNILSEYGHYDTHSENFVIQNDSLKIIDFGNFKTPGIWISDCLYLSSTLYAALSSKKELQKEIKEHTINYLLLREPKLKNDAKKITDVFFNAAEMNSRFRIKNKGFRIKNIFSFINSVLKLD